MAKLLLCNHTPKEMSLYQALLRVRAAWSDLTVETVKNAWKKLTLLSGGVAEKPDDALSKVDDEEIIILAKEDAVSVLPPSQGDGH